MIESVSKLRIGNIDLNPYTQDGVIMIDSKVLGQGFLAETRRAANVLRSIIRSYLKKSEDPLISDDLVALYTHPIRTFDINFTMESYCEIEHGKLYNVSMRGIYVGNALDCAPLEIDIAFEGYNKIIDAFDPETYLGKRDIHISPDWFDVMSRVAKFFESLSNYSLRELNNLKTGKVSQLQDLRDTIPKVFPTYPDLVENILAAVFRENYSNRYVFLDGILEDNNYIDADKTIVSALSLHGLKIISFRDDKEIPETRTRE